MSNYNAKVLPGTLLLCAAFMLPAGCKQKSNASEHGPGTAGDPVVSGAPRGPASIASTAQSGRFSKAEIAHFDALTSPSVIFTDRAERERYVMHSPMDDEGRRSYVFELRIQPEMTQGRHFEIVTVTWARASAFEPASGASRLRSTGGPGGSILDASARTDDQAYEVNVSLATLLPRTVNSTSLDLEQTALSLARRHAVGSFKP
jgi:hypothetical protein